ncbi:MAG: recombinase family protein [Pseudolabrys sp.]|nr:recombinase family protein [Pseudolabrys sp.]
MAVVGYGRVSSVGQSLEVQLEQLAAAGCDEIFAEKRSGTTTAGREKLEEALRFVRKGDVLVVTRLDRLARSLTDLSRIIDDLTARQVGFRCLQQDSVDTTKPEGRLMLGMLACFAAFETDLRKERQREGIDKAKEAGRYRGRPPTIDGARIEQLRREGVGPSAIAKQLGIGRASVYRHLDAVE